MTKHDLREQQLLEFMTEPRTLSELMDLIGTVNDAAFRRYYTTPMLKAGKIEKIGAGRNTKYVAKKQD